MLINQKTTQVSTLQKQVSDITTEVEESKNTVYEIHRHKDTVGYLLSPDLAGKFFEYLEQLEMLSDHKLVRSLIAAKAELDSGGGESLDDVLAELG